METDSVIKKRLETVLPALNERQRRVYLAAEAQSIGLAEIQQTLVLNDLRGQVRLQADGQLKTGRDVIVSAMLGAEEYGFATSALIVLGCMMLRKCHLNTCPVGVATQDEALREKFKGRSEYLINYFNFLAEEVREYLAALGFRSIDEIVGRSDLLIELKSEGEGKAKKMDLSRLIYFSAEDSKRAIHSVKKQEHKLNKVLDVKLIKALHTTPDKNLKVEMSHLIKNTDRSVGAMLSGR